MYLITWLLMEVTAPLVCQSTMSGRCSDALRGGWYVRAPSCLAFLLLFRNGMLLSFEPADPNGLLTQPY